MNRNFHVLLAGAVLCGGLNCAALAQTAVPPIAATAKLEVRSIMVRNVSPNLMASWIDTAHNTTVEQFKDVKPIWAIGKTASEIKEMLSLPAGVSAVIGDNPRNALLIVGTPAGIEKVVEKVALLDQPLQQVEVFAQYVKISAADVEMLGIDFAQGAGSVEVGMAATNIQSKIDALVAQKRAKILTAPHVMAILGATATLKSSTTTPIVVSIKNEDGFKIQNWSNTLPPQDQYLIGISTSIGLAATPNLNADGTIALQVGPLRTLGLTGLNPNDNNMFIIDREPITLRNLDNIPTKPIILKDGQTAALRGLTWNVGPGFPNDPQSPAMNVLALVTARIVRRAGNDIQTVAFPR